MQKQAAAIVSAYFEARASGDAEGLAKLLSDDFKEIDVELGARGKQEFLETLRQDRGAAPRAPDAVMEMVTVGNVVRVRRQNGAVPPQPETRVFAISEGRIKLAVQVAPDPG